MSTTPILSVSALNQLARGLIEDHFSAIRVEGEISNLTQASSGHLYFTLKDASAQIKAVMFRSQRAQLRLQPENGGKVVAEGQLSVYPARGDMQLLVTRMQAAGLGDLHRAFMQLKQRLEQEGLFAQARPLPDAPQRLALITSRQGAAVHDILSILKRRAPALAIDLFAVAVQGEGAAAQMRQALSEIARRGVHDVVILGRGGGSLEDLWAFNDEALARAIVASPIPVISAVGHETDFSIADFAADLRAATPSAAAEIVSAGSVHRHQLLRQLQERLRPPRALIERAALRLDDASQRLQQTLRLQLGELRRRQEVNAGQLQRLSPPRLIEARRQRLQQAQAQLPLRILALIAMQRQHLAIRQGRLSAHSLHLSAHHQRLTLLHTRLQELVQRALQERRSDLEQCAHRAHVASPLATLARGYSILSDSEGRIVRDSHHLHIGERLQARLAHGMVTLSVEHTLPDDLVGLT